MSRINDETSDALLAAVHRLLSNEGPHALTVRRIAKEADVSTMNVYSRFGGKDGVIDEVYSEGYRKLFSMLAEITATDDVIADLTTAAQTYRNFALANPTYYGVMFRQGLPRYTPSRDASAVAAGGQPLFEALIERGQLMGQITSAFHAAEISVSLWAECHGYVSLELDRTGSADIDWSAVFEIGIGATIDGLRPGRGSLPRRALSA